MNSKEYYQKKNNGFINYWQKSRQNRFKYASLQSIYFITPLSVIMQLLEGYKSFIFINFIIKFIIGLISYFLLTYFITFVLHEKRFKKLTKQKQKFDH